MDVKSFADAALFRSLYGEACDAEEIEPFLEYAGRVLSTAVTGVDGVDKLETAPPEGSSAEAVGVCICAIADALFRIREAGKLADAARTLTETDVGLRGGVIASMSAGNEYVTYRSFPDGLSVYERASSDPRFRAQLLYGIVREHLSGVRDKNGVRLLYMGAYPAFV